MKIIDTFLLFNEIDLLDMRLNILKDHVDYFVITESDTTFSGNSKELYFEKNKHLFENFKDKIIYNPVSIPSNIEVTWDREIWQRNSQWEVIEKISTDDDLILTSDVDEIPSLRVLEKIDRWFNKNELYHFQQDMFMYYLNNFKTSNWFGTRACSKSVLSQRSIDDIRESTEIFNKLTGIVIQNAGWHFSYLGGEEQIKYKLESFSHQEFNNDGIKQNIQNSLNDNRDLFGRYVNHSIIEIDNRFPEFIINNKQKYKNWINELR
jgi:beta-1,4-mannosyl-glycoprotein beta-1,4-N-acetylglucosaminyltransferase